MRLLSLLLTGLIVVAGLVGAVFLMGFALVLFILRRLFGRPAATPHFQWSARTSMRPGPAARPTHRADPNVIDVETTEVKGSAHSQPRLDG